MTRNQATPLVALVALSAGSFAALFAALAPAAAQPVAQPAAPEWRVYADRTGTRVDYPAGVFSVQAGTPPSGEGVALRTPDARARLAIYSEPNPQGLTPAAYIKAHFTASRAGLDYRRIARTFFAVSGVHGGDIYYSRCNFGGAALHCIYLTYPRSEERAWDAIVTRISRTLRPLR